MEQKCKLGKSIFVKIALLVFSSIIIIVINFIGMGTLILHHNIPHSPKKSFLRYVDGIPGEIGIPPDKEKIKQLAIEYGLIILYKGPGYTYTTEKSFFLPLKMMNTVENNDIGIRGRYIYVVKKKDDHMFIIASSFFFRRGIVNFFLFFAVIFLIILFLIVHQIIRTILSPVKFLMTAVLKVGQGDFSYKVPVKKQDELGRLSSSFNSMTGMIKKMIEAKERLLLDVSHELRSPLTRIKVNLEFIEDPETRESLQNDVAEMEHMIKEILETEKIDHAADTIKFKCIDIVQVIRDVAGLFTEESNRIHLPAGKPGIMVKGNEVRMKMLFRNIIDNALHYSNKPVHIEIKEDTKNILISVADQGEGIPGDVLPYIFEPFYRADPSRSRETGGYGLGMYLCKKIVELHSGKIEMKSIPGKGTTVLIIFPRMYPSSHSP